MSYYKDIENQLHFLDDDTHTHILPDGCVQVADVEADAIRDANKAAAEAAIPAVEKAKNNIVAIEAAQTPRRIRESLLEIADKVGADCSFLRELEAKIAVGRGAINDHNR